MYVYVRKYVCICVQMHIQRENTAEGIYESQYVTKGSIQISGERLNLSLDEVGYADKPFIFREKREKKNIYLAALGLSCCMQDLVS